MIKYKPHEFEYDPYTSKCMECGMGRQRHEEAIKNWEDDMITTNSPPIPNISKVKRYNLLITIFGSHHGAGTAMVSHVMGEYDSLQECKEAGNEAKDNYSVSNLTFLHYTCVPVYKKSLNK